MNHPDERLGGRKEPHDEGLYASGKPGGKVASPEPEVLDVARVVWISADEMPKVLGLDVPQDVYWILARPAPLLGMVRPNAGTPWRVLHEHGIRRIVCLTDDAPSYDPAPLTFAHSVELEDLYGGVAPSRLEEERGKAIAAASSVVQCMRQREGVVVHCAGGTGRTGTVIGAALVALGVPADEAIAHLQRVHALRGRSWPESPWQEDLVRGFRVGH